MCVCVCVCLCVCACVCVRVCERERETAIERGDCRLSDYWSRVVASGRGWLEEPACWGERGGCVLCEWVHGRTR